MSNPSKGEDDDDINISWFIHHKEWKAQKPRGSRGRGKNIADVTPQAMQIQLHPTLGESWKLDGFGQLLMAQTWTDLIRSQSGVAQGEESLGIIGTF